MSGAVTLRPDPEALRAFWRVLVCPGHVHEVRAPKTRRGPLRWYGTASGYFNNEDDFIKAVQGVTGLDAEAVYLTLNPVNPALLARATNRIKKDAKETTSDGDIVRRTTLLIDFDPERPSGISATDEERDAALAVRDATRSFLAEDMGCPDPLAGTMSGNGGALLYRVDLPNDTGSAALVMRVLKALHALFGTPAVKVDAGNFNAARITKIIGTVAAKGDSILNRPWRLASGTFTPDAPPVLRDRLEAVAALAPEDPPRPSAAGRNSAGPARAWDLRELLTRNNIGWREKPKARFTVFQLDRCLTSQDHADGACVMEFDSGALAYVCLHDRCRERRWADVRGVLGLSGTGFPPPEAPPNSFLPLKGEVGKETNFAPRKAADLLAQADEPIPWVWEPYLPEGALALLVSFMKVGKSTLAYPLALAVAQGRPFLGYPTKRGGVLILAVEEHPRDVRRRLRRFGMRPEDPIYVHPGRLDNTPATFKALREFIQANGIVAVFLDTLPRFWTVENENDNAEVIRHAAPFLDLARETGAVVILLHHDRKSGGEDGRGIRGGSALFGLADQALLLDKRQGGRDTQRALRAIGRYDETPRELVIELAGDEYRRVGTAEEVDATARTAKVWDALADEPRTVESLHEETQVPHKQIREALAALGDKVIREGMGKKGDPFTYRRAGQNSIRSQPNPIGEETNSEPGTRPETAGELVEVEP